ncbi:hypothetical protein CASFOL_008319 [Castilleja foliolosa]|uniref:Uncharacterized protein n=1 Tax=Castilleja foliolosa TaxID=1961234 RepID=A0ABD3E2N8_9LAMI
METLCPASIVSNSNWLIHHGQSTPWTKEENKKFESALAIFDDKTPNRWFEVAAMIPGKSVYDVMNQYRELVADVSDIEAGLVPVPGYMSSSPFTLELADDRHRNFDVYRKSCGRTNYSDQERKKGVPWTEEEHRRFLLGLEKHGKGDWRNISRNFVISKTPTQVASHAQKYYLRQLSGGKDRRRPSIHDITTVDLTTNNNNSNVCSPKQTTNGIKPNELQGPAIGSIPKTILDSNRNHNDDGTSLMVFDSAHPNSIMNRYILNF